MAKSSNALAFFDMDEEDEGNSLERVRFIVGGLDNLAQEQVSRKVLIEDRWYEDLRNFYGRYDADTESELKRLNRSRLFIKLSRQKTTAWEARIGDIAQPTDERNWAIEATPVPELEEKVALHRGDRDMYAAQASQYASNGQADLEQEAVRKAKEAGQAEAQHREMLEQAREQAAKMGDTIDDQLVESHYPSQIRLVIHDACKLGTGILKGPMNTLPQRRRWSQEADPETGKPFWALGSQKGSTIKPTVRRVDPWNYFPDMAATSNEDKEFDFERYLMTKSELRKLADQPGFDKDAIRRVLVQDPRDSLPNYLHMLRAITGVDDMQGNRYTVWEYNGPMPEQDITSLMQATTPEGEEIPEIDPLMDLRVVVWFCNGELLKFGIHPLDSGDSLYDVFNFERDDTSLFGFGVPHLMADSQAAANGAWRMMMDNGSLSAGPQVVVDTTQIEPQQGEGYALTPRKVWLRVKAIVGRVTSPALEVHNIPNNQNELAKIIELALIFMDYETNMPLASQGEPGSRQAPAGAQTMGGMAMLINSANVYFRRVVKNLDDQLITRMIRKLYDWNMQFNDDESVKGDMNVKATGSSVLLVREIQSQNLLHIVEAWSAHPILAKWIKIGPAIRKCIQSMMISSEATIRSDAEVEEIEAREAQNPKKSPEEVTAENRLQVAQIDGNTRLELAAITRDTEMVKLAQTSNMSLEKISAELKKTHMMLASKERSMLTEAALEEKLAQRAHERGEEPQGSGGNFSVD